MMLANGSTLLNVFKIKYLQSKKSPYGNMSGLCIFGRKHFGPLFVVVVVVVVVVVFSFFRTFLFKFNRAHTLTTTYTDFRCNTVSNDASEWFNFVECVQN